MRAQGIETIQQSRLGRAGRRAIDFISSDIGQKIRTVTGIQRQREQTLQLLQGFPLPEFLHGGAVNGRAIHGARGGLLAMLHPGEFVLSKEAVQAMGESLLSGFNRSPRSAVADVSGRGGGGGVAVNLTINAVDGASIRRWWRQNQGNLISAIRKATADRAL